MKTAADLAIPTATYDALLKVLAKLESGDLIHTPDGRERGDDRPGAMFNMNYAGERRGTGTIGCIGGWMSILLQCPEPDQNRVYDFSEGANLVFIDGYFGELYNLMRPNAKDAYAAYSPYYDPKSRITYDYDGITPAQAAQAIRNYLVDGEADWKSILPPPGVHPV